MSQYQGSEWIERSLKVDNISEFGREVADLLGDVFAGIYHLSSRALHKVDWSDDRYISFIYGNDNLATFDGDKLTRLVVLSHDRMIRVSIHPRAFHYLELGFHKRRSRTGDMYQRMPTMEDHTEIIRNDYADPIPAGGNLVIVCAGGCGKTTDQVSPTEFWAGEVKQAEDPGCLVPIWTCRECLRKRGDPDVK